MQTRLCKNRSLKNRLDRPRVVLVNQFRELDRQAIEELRPVVDRPAPGNQPLAILDEWEAFNHRGDHARVRTLFLRGSECRLRCTMCDLWRHTHLEATRPGDIVQQVRTGLLGQPGVGTIHESFEWIKLYNASNFFDSKNVPRQDLPEIAEEVFSFDRVIVENHPRLLPMPDVADFQRRISGRLEIAMGLESIQPEILRRLNKQMTTDDFADAVQQLRERGIDVRAFVLLQPPWQNGDAALSWCRKTIDWAMQKQVRHVTIIPVRGGNGAMEMLSESGHFTVPRAIDLERILEEYIGHAECVVTADTWSWNQMRGQCSACSLLRKTRVDRMNLSRIVTPPIECNC